MEGGRGEGEKGVGKEGEGCFQPLPFGIPIDETRNKGYSSCDPGLENATEEKGDQRCQ